MTWYYNNEPFTTAPEQYQGFVYLITNTSTGKKYIGKKNLWGILKRNPLKGKTRRRHSRIETDWREYYGSSKTLQQDVETLGPHTMKREILILCANKNQMTYFEMKLQFEHNVLLDSNYYNEYIGGRLTARGLTE
jgi:hypothetical protein